MDEAVRQALHDYATQQDATTYEKLRQALIDSPDYCPYESVLDGVRSLFDAGECETALKNLVPRMSNYLLSPQAHLLTFYLLRELGHKRAARSAAAFHRLMLEGLLSTGDGSRERPYKVTHVSDEYDVLESFEKEVDSQSLIREPEHSYDKLICSDRTEYWFEITDLVARQESLRAKPDPRTGGAGR